MIKNAKFVAEWNNGHHTLEIDCKVNMNTGVVFDLNLDDYKDYDWCTNHLEYIVIDDFDYDVDWIWHDEDNGEYSIVADCRELLISNLAAMFINNFYGLTVSEYAKRDFLFEIVYDAEDSVVMDCYRKYCL